MPSESLIRWTYWGGWMSAVVALLYKLLVSLGVGDALVDTGIKPYHFWQSSFLLFLMCVATVSMARAKTA